MIIDETKLRDAARDYCKFWDEYDSKFSEYISGVHYSNSSRIDKLRECLCEYGIQRNVQPNDNELQNDIGMGCGDGYNPKKHQVILEVLDTFEHTNDWVSDIYCLEEMLYSRLKNEVRLLSLASKVLWQKVRGSYLVYDNDARKALKVRDKDISNFYIKWNALYQENYRSVVNALEAVIDDSPFMFYRYDDFRQDWFYRRIFDTYLINLTREQK